MGCGPSKEGDKPAEKKYDKPVADLPGKQKFIGDVGAVVMHQEERKQPVAVLIAFVPKASSPSFAGLCLVYYVLRTSQVYALELTDAELEEQKTACNVTFGWSAVFKSIASDFLKGKAKVATANDIATMNIEVTSVKDKPSQKISFKLPLVPTVGTAERFKYLDEPLARVGERVEPERCAVPEEEAKVPCGVPAADGDDNATSRVQPPGSAASAVPCRAR